jgi:hypothetical protein
MKEKYEILSLKPTQFAVGILEIESKIKEIEKLGKNKRKKLIDDNPIPIVLSPDGEAYLVDHHHFVLALSCVGVKKARVEVLHDLSRSKLSFVNFWKWMKKNGFYYPFCQFGEGPRNPLYLPAEIRGLADDPYRSLAWFCRQKGAYDKTDTTFAEFKWANFFRKKKLLDRHGRKGIDRALNKAIKLAKSEEARRLPGYIGKKKK